MPVYIDEMTSELIAFEGEIPLSERQMKLIVARVLDRIESQRRDEEQRRGLVEIRATAGAWPMPVDKG